VTALALTFVWKERLGSGQFGEVWLAFDTGLAVDRAVKVIPLSKVTSEDNFLQEAQILRSVTHDHIVRVDEAGRLDGNRLYIAMEYMPKGSVADEARGAPLPMTRAVRILCDALRGLEHVHGQGVVHRDIKPANILVGNYEQCKLSDFGLAARVGASGAASPEGYLHHAAPEIITAGTANVLTDVYAAGVTLYRLLNGDEFLPAFAGYEEYLQAIAEGAFPDRTRYRLYIPRSLRTVTNRAISIDPTRRYQDAASFRAALEQIRICCDWREEPTASGMLWTGGYRGSPLRVEMTMLRRGGVNVETRRRRSSGDWRRVTAACRYGVASVQAERFIASLLQGLVGGKPPA
jgi:serine/threonine protein kinase